MNVFPVTVNASVGVELEFEVRAETEEQAKRMAHNFVEWGGSPTVTKLLKNELRKQDTAIVHEKDVHVHNPLEYGDLKRPVRVSRSYAVPTPAACKD